MAQRSRQAPQAPVVPVPGQGAQGMQGAAILGQRRAPQPIQPQAVPVANGTAQGIAAAGDNISSGIMRWQDKQEARAREERGYAQQEKMAGISREHDKAMSEMAFGQSKELNRIAQVNAIQRETLRDAYTFAQGAFSTIVTEGSEKVERERAKTTNEMNQFMAFAQDPNLPVEQRTEAVRRANDLKETINGLNFTAEPYVRAYNDYRDRLRTAVEAGEPPPKFELAEAVKSAPPEVMNDLRDGDGIPSDINNVPEALRPVVGSPSTPKFVAATTAELYQIASIENAEQRQAAEQHYAYKVAKRADALTQYSDMNKKLKQVGEKTAPGYLRQAVERMSTAPGQKEMGGIQQPSPQAVAAERESRAYKGPGAPIPKPMNPPDPATFGREIMTNWMQGLQSEIGPQAAQRMNEYMMGERQLLAKQELPFAFMLDARFQANHAELGRQIDSAISPGIETTAEGGQAAMAVSPIKASLVDIAMKRYGFKKSEATTFVQQSLMEAQNTNALFMQRVQEAETLKKFQEVVGQSRLQMQALERAYVRDPKTGKTTYDPAAVGVLERTMGSEVILDHFLDVVEEIHQPGYIQSLMEKAEGSKAYIRDLGLDSKEANPVLYGDE